MMNDDGEKAESEDEAGGEEALEEPEGPKEKPEDKLNNEVEAAAAADEETLGEPEGPKEKPEDNLNDEVEAAAAADEKTLGEPEGPKEKPEDLQVLQEFLHLLLLPLQLHR